MILTAYLIRLSIHLFFVDTEQDITSQSLDKIQEKLNKHPLILNNKAWSDNYNYQSSGNIYDLYDLTMGPLTIKSPLEILQAQQEDADGSYGGMNYADKTYPKERYAFYNLPQEYYKVFNPKFQE